MRSARCLPIAGRLHATQWNVTPLCPNQANRTDRISILTTIHLSFSPSLDNRCSVYNCCLFQYFAIANSNNRMLRFQYSCVLLDFHCCHLSSFCLTFVCLSPLLSRAFWCLSLSCLSPTFAIFGVIKQT